MANHQPDSQPQHRRIGLAGTTVRDAPMRAGYRAVLNPRTNIKSLAEALGDGAENTTGPINLRGAAIRRGSRAARHRAGSRCRQAPPTAADKSPSPAGRGRE